MSWRAAALLPVLACAAPSASATTCSTALAASIRARSASSSVASSMPSVRASPRRPARARTRRLRQPRGALAAGGFAVAARQVWLQHLPPDRVPQCGPDLYFMLENFPLSRTLKTLVSGTGECAVVDWTLGFSIAEWSLGWFAVLLLRALARVRNSGSGS